MGIFQLLFSPILAGVARWREFIDHLMRRREPEQMPVTLHRRRIFILPTSHGLVMSVVMLAMLLGAINYNNSLAYALTFLLSGMVIIGMVHTFRNLYGLTLSVGGSQPLFCGEQATFSLSIVEGGVTARRSIEISAVEQSVATVDLALAEGRWVELTLPALRRGRLRFPTLTLSTLYPLGLFRAWGYLYPDAVTLVYPKPAARTGPPQGHANNEQSSAAVNPGSDDFVALRRYQPGDSLSHIHWKALAKEQGLLSKQFASGGSKQLWFRWEDTTQPDVEARLSEICRWIIDAEEAGDSYGVEIPGFRLTPGSGEGQRSRALRALALYGEAE